MGARSQEHCGQPRTWQHFESAAGRAIAWPNVTDLFATSRPQSEEPAAATPRLAEQWHSPLYLTFDSETMPEWFGMPDDKDLPSTFTIDYVRAWKRDGSP
jgi:hypothetical protein